MFGMMPWGGASVAEPNNSLLLCHFDGANGSTSLVDDSTYSRTISAVGSAQLSTSVKKWGTASLHVPNSSSGVYIPHDAAFNFSNGGTIEWWANPQSFVSSAYHQHWGKWSATKGTSWDTGHVGSNGRVFLFIFDGVNYYFWESSDGVVLNDNTFKHFAFQITESAPNLFQLWVNGVRAIRQTNGLLPVSSTADLWFGRDDAGNAGGEIYCDDFIVLPSPKYGDVDTIPVPTGPYTP